MLCFVKKYPPPLAVNYEGHLKVSTSILKRPCSKEMVYYI